MNFTFFVLAIFIFGFCAASKDEWNNFKIRHEKTYKNLIQEKIRYNIFKDNIKSIKEHNENYEKGLVTYTKAINQFADLTKDEFLNLFKPNNFTLKNKSAQQKISLKDLPNAIDWRTEGAVGPVTDQGMCGAPISASVGCIEAQTKIKDDKLVLLNIQNIIECVDGGCSGGFPETVFAYARDNGINADYESLPSGECNFSPEKYFFKITGYDHIASGIEEDLQSALVNIGPIAAEIDATANFQFYSSGIFSDDTCSPNQLNHVILVVGYASSPDYWIVRNSWGSSWGESGYIRIQRNNNNQCGIATNALYPIV